MKVLLICSSPHKEKSKTYSLAKQLVRGIFQQGIDVETIHLAEFQIFFCRHCDRCHKNIMQCPMSDDAYEILGKMLGSDGIILASPNYINQVTASMKALLDRSAHFIHCKRLLGKYVAGVVSSGSGQDRDVLNYIEYYAHSCGVQYSGGISSSVEEIDQKKYQAIDLGKKLISDIQEQKNYSQQLEIIERGKQHFKGLIKARKQQWTGEYQYWKDKTWL